MEIQKIFSNTENPEERIYSVLMTSEELALFSKKDSNEDDKLSAKDKLNKFGWKYLTSKRTRNIQRALAEDDIDTAKELNKRNRHIGTAISAGAGGVSGGMIGYGIGGAKGAAIGAGIGATATGGLNHILGKISEEQELEVRHDLNKSKALKNTNKRILNELNLAEGKIDEKTYLKNKKKLNKR